MCAEEVEESGKGRRATLNAHRPRADEVLVREHAPARLAARVARHDTRRAVLLRRRVVARAHLRGLGPVVEDEARARPVERGGDRPVGLARRDARVEDSRRRRLLATCWRWITSRITVCSPARMSETGLVKKPSSSLRRRASVNLCAKLKPCVPTTRTIIFTKRW